MNSPTPDSTESRRPQPEDRDRFRAQQVILEIARQSPGDEIEGTTRLFKVFYLAHLFYACDAVGYLSEWPIVKMPKGPGIDRFDRLLHELLKQEVLETASTHVGPYPSTLYQATGRMLPGEPLEPEAVAAIRKAVEFADGKTGAQLSDITHEFSHSWTEAALGDELNICIDLLSDEERKRAQRTASEVHASVEEAWK